MVGTTIELHFDDPDAERRFIDSSLAEAWPRIEASDAWEHGWFWAYGHVDEYDIGADGGLVRLVFDGDPDALLEAESDRWDEFEGLDSWDCTRYDELDDGETYESLLDQQRDAKGRVGGEREYRYKPLTARLALEYRREFDEPLPAAPEPGDVNPPGIGFWSLVHDLFFQCGYDWYDENDAYLRGMRNRLKSIAAYRGADAAREEYERLRAAWEAYEAELEEWVAENETGGAAVN